MRPVPPDEMPPVLGSDDVVDAAPAADCRTCELRSRCISYGWRSPGGVWFENAVVLRPRPGCRGFIGRGDDIRDHFGSREKTPSNH